MVLPCGVATENTQESNSEERQKMKKRYKELLACRPCSSQRSPLSRPNTSVWNEHCTDSCHGFTPPFTVSSRHPDSPALASLPAMEETLTRRIIQISKTAEPQQSSGPTCGSCLPKGPSCTTYTSLAKTQRCKKGTKPEQIRRG